MTNVIDAKERWPQRPARVLTVVKCDPAEAIELTDHNSMCRYVTTNLQTAVDAFRGVYGPSVLAIVLDRQAAKERTLAEVAL